MERDHRQPSPPDRGLRQPAQSDAFIFRKSTGGPEHHSAVVHSWRRQIPPANLDLGTPSQDAQCNTQSTARARSASCTNALSVISMHIGFDAV
jgi:hypothetical protein